MWPYHSAEAALTDALKLSRAMSYKNAMADLELGGGKAVIIGDARTQKTPALFEAFGRAVEDVGGKYWTAEDVGITPADLAHGPVGISAGQNERDALIVQYLAKREHPLAADVDVHQSRVDLTLVDQLARGCHVRGRSDHRVA